MDNFRAQRQYERLLDTETMERSVKVGSFKEWLKIKVLTIFKLKYMGWEKPYRIVNIRSWIFHVYNDFDPLTFMNDRDVQGLRILGFWWN